MTTLSRTIQLANRSRRFNKRARRVLAGMNRTLPQKDRALCVAYAVDVLGSKTYAPWLYAYANVAGQFREGWIPDNYFYRYVALRGQYRGIAMKRALTARLLGYENVPDIAAFVGGRFICPNNDILYGADIAEKLFEDADRVVFKSDNSHAGLGVVFLNRDTFALSDLEKMGDGLFQKVIRQHEAFDPVSPNSVATLRYTTVLEPSGKVALRATHLGMSATADDTHLIVTSGVGVPFDQTTGQLADAGLDPKWNPIDRHPATGHLFSNITVPTHDEGARVVLDMHRRFPMIECIGWDVAIDHTGKPQIMEMNGGHVSIKSGEALKGPNFTGLGWENRWRQD